MKRLRLRRALGDHLPAPAVDGLVWVAPVDRLALADLMYAAYVGTIDAEPSDTPEGARDEVHRTLDGVYGPFLPDASFALAAGDTLVSASLVTRYEGAPMIAFTLTRPGWAGQGLGRAVLTASLNALTRAGEARVDLAVTDGNTPAQRLYARLGFVVVPPAGGG